ncbi:hypothetical protein CH341_10660 [Rhodoplanes roseus]|uniref:Aldehyde oxidase/xanthine dehydrogenase a/b hammerhead domain-containing protein n=2 Tax=Rhodoplanes roseus TaxID=29409 RepID=A0A327L191_9BRAD|nr:hypothetical protein CH341_10660 [Rhodoplanes roseus]
MEDRPLVTGRGRFVDDIRMPDLLHAAFVRSAHAHARILGIDAEAARRVPGVAAVLTMDDLRPHLSGDRLVTALPSPSFRLDLHRPVLAFEETAHVGEPIAVVIALSRYVAEDAADLVEVSCEALPAVEDCRAALAPGSPVAHSSAAHNLVAEFHLGYGDVEAAFAGAAHVFREKLWQHRGGGHSIECRGLVARHDPVDDLLTVWSSTQTPHPARQILSDLLRRDPDRIRVVVPDVGGGFGPKLVFYPEEAVVAAAALLLGRPVKWIEDRREHFVATTQERDQYWDVELAVDADARILGVRGSMIHDHGAYSARGTNVPYGAAAAMPLPYMVPAYRLDVRCAATNKVPVTPVRGAGQPQGVFAMERLLDRAAQALGLDRDEIRRRNLVPAERMPYATPLKTRGGMQVVLDSGDYPGCQALALLRAGWEGFAARKATARAAGRRIGIGLANSVEGTGRGPYEQVRVRVAADGRVRVATGAAPMGQGTRTMLAQIVAEQLGGDMANVDVVAGDTAAVALGFGGFNSRQAVVAGSAAHAAAIAVRTRVLAAAASLLEASEADLDVEGRTVKVKGSDVTIDLGAVARAAAGLPGFAVPGGQPGLDVTESVVIDEMAYANASAVAEVEVDAGTGTVTITKITFAHDCGRVIHPGLVDGQVIGGIAHGIGNALFERMGYDADAQPVTTTLGDYLLVTAEAIPAIDLVHMSSPTALNALGVKGVGEAGVIPITAAVASAVEDALDDLGVTITGMPLSPAGLLARIRQATTP